jgi:phosphotransferase system enzyme I (PtsI)
LITLKGTAVFGGIAFGKIAYFKRKQGQVKRSRVEDSGLEIARFEAAKAAAIGQLKELHDKARGEVGEAHAMIFEVHQMMLDDGDYIDSVVNIVTSQQVNAEYAVAVTADNFAAMFAAMDDEYMKERAADVKDISERVIGILSGAEQGGISFDAPVILAAEDLAPSETVTLDKDKILSFITMGGSVNSHTAILARMMNIPAIVGLGDALGEHLDGKDAIVDGFNGSVYINPDAQTLAQMKEKAEADAEKKRLLEQLKGKENVTLDGRTIDIFANIGNVADTAAALQNDAGGIGLFRSEFLYLQTRDYPTEEEQFQAYKTVAETMAGKKVVIRTLDIGADKQIGYFNLPVEENPALGFRAIRICLERPEIFKTQLRALYRASAFGNIAIMFPMIISVEEVIDIKKIIAEVHSELDAANVPYSKDVECGIMIETPASVMISDLLAKEVDFFSVGTNDLTQYTLALDRQNPQLERFHNAHHTAILRMIQMAADNAHKEGKWIGICGELAADLELTETFLKMGIDELSVSPPYVLPLREKVRSIGAAKPK